MDLSAIKGILVMNIELIQILCSSLFLLLTLVELIQMEISFYQCEHCFKLGNFDSYGYAGMIYCKKCAKKEGYK
jgi:hypothetical protein